MREWESERFRRLEAETRADMLLEKTARVKMALRSLTKKSTSVITTRIVEIDYTNWRGHRRVRQIVPVAVTFDSNDYHPEPQWLLLAYDGADKSVVKTFAMSRIHSWTPLR